MSPTGLVRSGGAWVQSGKTGKAWIGSTGIAFAPPDDDPGDQTIFGAETPANVAEDGVALAQGVRFTSSTNGVAIAGRWWCGVSPPTSAKAAIYRVSDQVQLGAATFGTLNALAWNTVTFSSPISIVAGTAYAAVCWTQNRYPFTAAYSWPHVSDDLTATGAYFSVAADLAFPSTSSTLNFFCDLVYNRS